MGSVTWRLKSRLRRAQGRPAPTQERWWGKKENTMESVDEMKNIKGAKDTKDFGNK
jgi:hypothetical protein